MKKEKMMFRVLLSKIYTQNLPQMMEIPVYTSDPFLLIIVLA
jgi:hypothetical protein